VLRGLTFTSGAVLNVTPSFSANLPGQSAPRSRRIGEGTELSHPALQFRLAPATGGSPEPVKLRKQGMELQMTQMNMLAQWVCVWGVKVRGTSASCLLGKLRHNS
jgi:hypothetical protein